MTQTPFTNAVGAALYIVGIVFAIHGISSVSGEGESLLMPIAALSLFVLSASVMGFLFIYEPFRLYFEGQKSEAVLFFLKTVGFFACFVLLFVAAILFTSSL